MNQSCTGAVLELYWSLTLAGFAPDLELYLRLSCNEAVLELDIYLSCTVLQLDLDLSNIRAVLKS